MKAPALFFTALMIASVHQILSGETSGDWTYTVTDNQATITGYSGDGGAVEIPAEVDGVSVVKVGDEAFKDNTSVTSITIPDSVTSIGNDAFRSCTSLTSITIPDSVTSIGDWAFAWCDNLTSVTLPILFMDDYQSYGLSTDQVRLKRTAIDTLVATAEATARTAGQNDVTSDPATYSLFTAADVTGAETAARTLGQQDVVNAPSSFDLYTASDLVVPKFLNLSNRAYVGIGDEILIGSMIILDKPMRILVRASGPSLANAAVPVPNPLLDPPFN